ncbi:hypothetical protein TNCV_247671 [Trichonephila clavipes]|nr:hypothetical protein TNCV_247671 [Trichonephila clavipes]
MFLSTGLSVDFALAHLLLSKSGDICCLRYWLDEEVQHGGTLDVGVHPLFRTLDLKEIMANILLNSLICFSHTKSFDCAVSPFNRLHNGSGGSLTLPLEQHMPGVSPFHLSALHLRQTFDIFFQCQEECCFHSHILGCT